MTEQTEHIRTRIAPSPTGDPHVGTGYMAQYNRAFAHRNGGKFILRIEDTDQERYSPTAVGEILESLAWLGLTPDEGPGIGGDYGPYVQTERRELYVQHAMRLVTEGKAYRCFCTKERLEQMRREQMARKEPTRYDRRCLRLSPEEIERNLAEGLPYVVRMIVPDEGTTSFDDLIRGEISFENRLLDDQVILKSDGLPTYHLAVVVDDHMMDISHIVRAEEWIASTPKHVLLYRYLGWEMPKVAHLPLLRNADRSKISKRKNPTSLKWYREQGFLPEAMLNFLALMGWSRPREEGEEPSEIFTYEDVEREFSFERVTTSGPVFDLVKLTSINGKYIRMLSDDELFERLQPYLPEEIDRERVRQVVPVIKDRLTRLGEFMELTDFFFGPPPDYDASLLVPKKVTPEQTVQALHSIYGLHMELPEPWAHEAWEAGMRKLAEDLGLKAGDVFMMLRVATSGRTASPPLFESLQIIGKQETLKRLDSAWSMLQRPASKAEVLDKIGAGRTRFAEALAKVDPGLREQQALENGWSIKDTLAHVTAWEQLMLTWIRDKHRAEPLGQLPTDEINERIYTKNKDRPWDEVWLHFERSYQEVLREMESISEEDLLNTGRLAWLEDEPLWSIVAANTYWHYDEHAEMLEAI